MATLPETLKHAVLSQNWDLICTVYTTITGEGLSPPEPNKEDWMDMEIPVNLGVADGITAHELIERMPSDDEVKDALDGMEVVELTAEDTAKEVVIMVEIPGPENVQKKETEEVVAPTEAELAKAAQDDLDRIDAVSDEDAEALLDKEPEYKQEELKPNPNTPSLGVNDKFAVTTTAKGGNQFQIVDEDGNIQAGKSSMGIPVKRKNRFKDNKELFADELVSKNPNMGTPTQSSGQRLLLDGDEGKTGTTIDVVCSLCDENEKISTSLAYGWTTNPKKVNTYKCNACQTQGGRARNRRKILENLERTGEVVRRFDR